jgi:cell wall-associated NlpC family hydrolase
MTRHRWAFGRWSGLVAIVLLLVQPALQAREPTRATGIVGVDTAQLDPGYWIRLQPGSDAVILERGAIAAQNRRLLQTDASTRDIATLPDALSAAQVRAWIEALSSRPTRTLYDQAGAEIPAASMDGWMEALDLEAIAPSQPTRFGLIVHRAALRTFPTRTRVFNRTGDTDIDRFQENAFFPGTPVAIVHESRDRDWWFVVGNLYAAWIEKRFVAEGDKATVLGYADRTPYLVVTGAEVRTTTTPEAPALSDLQLDMGVRVPWLRDFPGARGVNGQAAYVSYVIELPVRDADGRLRIAPALLPRTADVSPHYLPLTRANLLRQSFKFLGERYGWGHDYDARDCSGFVSEVYRSMGVILPRNTRDQSVSPALNRIALTEADDAARRARIAGELQVGDLVYIPGHVMMVIGHDRGMPYVIHDTNGGSWLGAEGQLVAGHLNGVSVTPLTSLRFDREHSYIDRMTNIQRIRP